MEPVALATAVTTVIFAEALKEGGKNIGKSASEQVARVLTVIREKFKIAGTEGLLTRTQNKPTESNKTIFQAELETQINEDESFSRQIQELMKQLAQRKVQVLTSNSNCPFIRDLYKSFRVETITAARSINSKASKRGKITEVLAIA